MKLKIVIFNHDQRASAELLYSGLAPLADSALFDSGSSPAEISPLSTHRFGNILWTGCWSEAWRLFPESDAIWGIGGDVALVSAPSVCLDAIAGAWPFGTWSPMIEGRAHEYMSDPASRGSRFSVRFLEGIALAMSREVWLAAQPFGRANPIGHGEDLALCHISRARGDRNVLDGTAWIGHPGEVRYDLDEAKRQMFAGLSLRFGTAWQDRMEWRWGEKIAFGANCIARLDPPAGNSEQ